MIYKFTSLGRPLDLHNMTNVGIMLFTLLGGVIAGTLRLFNGDSLLNAVLAGLITGASVFIAWVISREIDPDNPLAAFVGSGLALVASLFVAPLNILVLTGVMMFSRIVNRTVGPAALLADTVLLMVVAIVIVFSGYWVFGFIAGLAFLLDAVMVKAHQMHFVPAFIAFAATLAYALLNDIGTPGALTLPYVLVVGVITVFFLAVIFMSRAVRSGADFDQTPLDLRRVQAGMLLVLLTGLVMLWHGNVGVETLSPLWAAVLGVGIYRIVNLQTDNPVSIVESHDRDKMTMR